MIILAVKNTQIIIRLSEEKKEKLQQIADSENIDMSKLIRDKIDEIIKNYENRNNFAKMILKSSYDEYSRKELKQRLINMQEEFQSLVEYINNYKK